MAQRAARLAPLAGCRAAAHMRRSAIERCTQSFPVAGCGGDSAASICRIDLVIQRGGLELAQLGCGRFVASVGGCGGGVCSCGGCHGHRHLRAAKAEAMLRCSWTMDQALLSLSLSVTRFANAIAVALSIAVVFVVVRYSLHASLSFYYDNLLGLIVALQ